MVAGPLDRGAEGERKLSRYSAVALLFHWGIALLIGVNLYVGFRMGVVSGLEKFDLFQLHKSVGVTVLLLSLLRLAWRLFNPPPPHVDALKGWEHAVAGAVHTLLYGIMIGMPLTGWIVVSASPLNLPTLLFHTIPWPHVGVVHDLPAAAKAQVYGLSDTSHIVLAWGALGLIAMHMGAALKHHFLDRDAVLLRMVPLLRRRPRKG
jgi:cytochrome b561